MQDMLRRADGRDWGESLCDIDLPDAAGLATQKKEFELMTRKMNRGKNESGSRKHSPALMRFCFNISYLVPAIFIDFLLSR